MTYRNEQRKVLKLDYTILVLSIIGLFMFATLFVVIENAFKFLFLGFSIYTIVVMFLSINGIMEYYKERSIKKYNSTRVNMKLFNKRRRTVTKTI